MKAILTRMPVTAIAILIATSGTTLRALSREDAVRVDLLFQRGTQLAERDSLTAAAAQFQTALEVNPKHAPSYVGLGHVHLKSGNLKKAEKAFRQALRKRKNYAPALNGLGLVFRETDKMLDWAIKYFRSSYQADRRFLEAYINLAQVYRTIGDTKELDTYEKLVKVDPEHSDAWFQIGRIYTYGEAGRYRNVKKAEAAYRRQLEANPRHFGARTYLGQLMKESGRTDEAIELLKPVLAVPNAFQRRALLEIAEVHQTARDHDLADAPLDAYVASLEPKERAFYYDLSLVAIGDELTRFQESAEKDRKALSEAFWLGRDPAPATAANERWIEHCRRVAYAREHFGEHQFPWDARGEVYVRYGTPEHISTSENIRFETDPKVLAVKERLMNQAGEALQHLLLSRRMVSFYREMDGSSQKGMDDQETLSTILGYPVYPVRGVWQYWIYTKVGGGVEVTFVQERTPGPYKYAEMPHAGALVWVDEITGRDPRVTMLTDEPKTDDLHPSVDTSAKSNLIWQRMNPGIVMHRVARKTPETYVQDFATAPLDFYFDQAWFKDEEGSALEVYFGIPTRDLHYVTGADGRLTANVKIGLALYDEDNKPVYRSSEEILLYATEAVDTTKFAFAPEMDRFSVTPGAYRLSVQILDTSSDRSQVYNREVAVSPFGHDSLRLSDIEMAALIRPSRGSKFTKGKIEVVPNPSLFYFAGQPVFVYYEVYNLKKDEFGRTKYRILYELQSLQKGNVVVRMLNVLGRFVGVDQKSEIVTVEYAHEGENVDEYGYLELDMSNTDPGNQMLTVSVVDDNSRQTSTSTATFTIR